jgi:hypothetical protein
MLLLHPTVMLEISNEGECCGRYLLCFLEPNQMVKLGPLMESTSAAIVQEK